MGSIRRVWWRVLLGTAVLSTGMQAAGPLKVAGSAFAPNVLGVPIIWRGGNVQYYTDLGNLSATITGAQADAVVASAFALWANVPTVALTLRAGKFAEDISGADVALVQGALQLPADASPNPANPFIAVLYDYDGGITDTLLGPGASDPLECNTNAISTLVDSYTAQGYLNHVIVIVNGNCASSTNLLKYRLVRALGRALGLGWSQTNDDVVTSLTPPPAQEYQGWPMMHPLDVPCLQPNCYTNIKLATDDQVSISRLYPVTAANLANFPGKSLLSATTIRISGTVQFPSGTGMQGVNVVARLMDPVSGLPSGAVVATCVSGFLFAGNVGNPILGFTDGNGNRYDSFGSSDATLQGYFDIPGLPIPQGQSQASYQISVEAMNPLYIGGLAVGSYEQNAVAPSGSFQPQIIGPLSAGANVGFNIVMQGASSAVTVKATSMTAPEAVSASGIWASKVEQHAQTDYITFQARANRVLSVEVDAIDDSNRPTAGKLAPAIGIWDANAPDGAPPGIATGPFNSQANGATILRAQTLRDGALTVAVADLRGDGRPDFGYYARVLYADSFSPARVSSGQGNLTITGRGFSSGITVNIGTAAAAVLTVSTNRIVVAVPVLADGLYDIWVHDAVSGADSKILGELIAGSYGEQIQIVSGTTVAQIPVGTATPQPLKVRVTDGSGVAVGGAAVRFSVAPADANLTACGAPSCTIFTNALGEAQSGVFFATAGGRTVSASLAGGQVVATAYTATLSSLALAAMTPEQWINASAARVSLVGELVQSGNPVAGQTVKFTSTALTSAVMAATATDGSVSVNLSLMTGNATATVLGCVQPGNSVCATFLVHLVQPAQLALEKIAGDGQTVIAGHAMTPLMVRVVDASSGNPVCGVALHFAMLAFAAHAGTAANSGNLKLVRASGTDAVSALDGSATVTIDSDLLLANINYQVTVTIPGVQGSQSAVFMMQSRTGP